MTWWAALPHALVLALLIAVPGALALRLLGVRALAGLAGAPAVTLAAVGVLSVVFAPLGLAWRLHFVLGGLAALLGLVALGARQLRAHRDTASEGRADVPWLPGALGARGVLAVTSAVVTGTVILSVPVLS